MKHASIILGLFVLISCGSSDKNPANIKNKIRTEETRFSENTADNEIPSANNEHHKGDSDKKKTAPPPPVPPVPYPIYDPIEPIEPFLIGEPEPYIEEAVIQIEDTNEVLSYAEEMPEFPGGIVEMNKFIAKNLQYPEIAKEMALEGKVYVRFTVLKDGSLTDFKIMRGLHPSLDKEAIRVVKLMPKWKAARHGGKLVNCFMTIPIKYSLN